MPTRILIVDDNTMVRTVLRKYLETVPGWQVCGEASNGQEGIEKAQQVKPNFIVLDLSMPVMNGLEAARVLNKMMPAVPMVLFTSFITHHLEEEAMAAGVRRVIAKDKSMADLISAVHLFAMKDVA
jgi:two-component system, NarL family, nitrate/nitrite response regulator NarL